MLRSHQRTKRQRHENGEASVNAYLEQLGQEPHFLALSHPARDEHGDAGTPGGAGSGPSLPAVPPAYMAFEDDLDEDIPAGKPLEPLNRFHCYVAC